MTGGTRPRALMVSENEGLPGDRRVWAEATTLVEAGWEVTAICPEAAAEDQPAAEELEGVSIRRFPLERATGAAGYLREYAQAARRIRSLARALARERPFDVVHVGSPPDLLVLALRSERRRGARLIFDHHDLSPELFTALYGRRGPVRALLCALERAAVRTADVVIVPNCSYRRIAIERNGADPERVFTVRNGPDLERFRPTGPAPELRRGRRYLLAYLGVMGRQDGIDHAVEALAALARIRGPDFHAVFIGDGDVIEPMRALAERLGIGEQVEFAGWRGDEDIRRWLSTADVCLAPDPPNELNDVSTMAKIPEYMAMGAAIASYDLAETRVSAGPAAAYAEPAEPAALARCIDALLEDPERRREMGRIGRERVRALSWRQSRTTLLAAYTRATRGSEPARWPSGSGGVSIGGAAHGARHELR